MQHIQIIISGNVENTGFRFYALRGASRFGIRGFVMTKNKAVIVEAEGENEKLEAFVEWCRAGSEGSFVESLVTIERTIYGYDDFKIL